MAELAGIIRASRDTVLKQKPVDSSQLTPDLIHRLSAGAMIRVKAVATSPTDGHYLITIDQNIPNDDGTGVFNTWYAFASADHWEILEDNRPAPKDTPAPPTAKGKGLAMTLPGFEGAYYSGEPIQAKNRYGKPGNFTWGEALHANIKTGHYRKPHKSSVVKNIIEVADVMEEIRHIFGDRPIQINSWFRDFATNKAVGGASQSQHLTGGAVDFVVRGVSTADVYARINPWWGARGGLASSSVFTHIDIRGGYKARWSYGY